MKSLVRAIAVASAALISSASSSGEEPKPSRQPAAPPVGRSPGEMFKRADADGDSKVTKEEFIKARTAEMEQAFARIDTNGDGAIDVAEAERFAQMMRGGMQAREGGPRPEGERRPDGEKPRMPAGEAMDEPFQRLDRDGSGQLSREEFEVGLMRMREMMQRGGLPGRPAGQGGGPTEGFRRPPEQDGEPRRP